MRLPFRPEIPALVLAAGGALLCARMAAADDPPVQPPPPPSSPPAAPPAPKPGEPPAAPPAAPPTSPQPAAQQPAAAPAPKPTLDAFVCLTNGEFLPGAAEKGDDVVGFTGADGKKQELPREKVLLAVAGGKSVVKVDKDAEDFADQSGIYTAWRDYFRTNHLARLAGGKFGAADEAARTAYVTDLLAVADRLAKWKLRYAAMGLFADALDAGAWDDDLQTRCMEWEPVYFPLSPPDEEKGKLLAVWCREIVPMGGTFAPKKSATAAPLPTHWVEDVVTLRSRNLLIRSRVMEPELVGMCLRQGEATVRALEGLLGIPEYGNDEPMEIRLYQSRKEYLEDTSGKRAMLWSGGYFTPGEGVSRFYVTRNVKGQLDNPKEQGGLYEVLSHELTHHWLEMRRLRGGRQPDHQPGHWIVEGFARFIEDHAAGLQEGKVGFDNPRNEAVVDTQMRRHANALMPMSRIVDLSPFEFHNNLAPHELGCFYDEGASIVFFMMNRRGPDGRKRLIEYMRKQYAGEFWDMPPADPYGRKEVKIEDGKPVKETWKVLGFATSSDMENAFHAFLEKP